MAVVYYGIVAKVAGVPETGLTPTWHAIYRLSDGAAVSSPPSIAEVGLGVYRFGYDAEVDGEAVGIVDLGASVPDAERYQAVELAAVRGRVLAGLAADGRVTVATNQDKTGYKLAADGLDLIEIDTGLPVLTAVYRISALLGGKCAGAGTGTMMFYAMGDPAELVGTLTVGIVPGDRATMVWA